MNLIGEWRERRKQRREERRRRAKVMLGPKVELPGGLRQWTAESMQWMVDQFGVGPLRRPPVLPSEFLPDDYDGSEAAARALCLKVCEWMDVPADHLRISFRMNEVRTAAQGAAAHSVTEFKSALAARQDPEAEKRLTTLAASGLRTDLDSEEIDALRSDGFGPELQILEERELVLEYQRCLALTAELEPERRAALQRNAEAIWSTPPGSRSSGCWFDLRKDSAGKPTQYHDTAIMLPADLLSDPAGVVAATAHELGHEVLWGRGLIDTQRPDAEAMADLFAVFQGFGIFLVNQAIEPAKGHRLQVDVFGYLGETGYAEALASYWLRHREQCPEQPVLPTWRKELDWTARHEVVWSVERLNKPATDRSK